VSDAAATETLRQRCKWRRDDHPGNVAAFFDMPIRGFIR
jgi:hypothetical protein